MRLRRASRLTGLILIAFAALVRAPADARDDAAAQRFADAVEALPTDPQRAAELLENLDTAVAPIAEYVVYYQGLAAQKLGDDAGARARFQRALTLRPSSPIGNKAAAELAPLLLEAGERAELLALAQERAREGSSSPDAARIALAAGKALADAQPREAAQWLMRARRFAPGSPMGSDAASLLSDLRRFAPDLRPHDPEALLAEARLSAAEGDQGAEAALLDQILTRYARDPVFADAALLRSRIIAADKGRRDAATWLETRAERTPTRDAKARLLVGSATALWNMDDTAAARRVFDRAVALGVGGAETQRAHYALGRIHESEARYPSAALEYRKAAAGPDPQVARESRWRSAWVAYLGEDFSLAADRFQEITERQSADKDAREEALYWQARSRERAGDKIRAQFLYRDVIEEFPDGYYAYLAEPRVGTSAAAPTVIALHARPSSPESLRALQRAQLLDRAGLHDFGIEELRAAEKTATTAEKRALLDSFVELGAYAQALHAALSLFRSGDLREEELYPYLYPHAYADVVEREARANRIDPHLVYSLIRQESLFDRRAVSPSSAYGLMQLLLSTARRVASEASPADVVQREDLFRPEINIRLGVAYLAELARRFDGNEVLMLAGYNAGEQAADRWRARLSGLQADEFVEQISYRETRDYVKKILRNYRNYRRLYGDGGGTRSQQLQ